MYRAGLRLWNKAGFQVTSASLKSNHTMPRRKPAFWDIDYLWQTVTFEMIKDSGIETGQMCSLLYL